MPAWLPHILTLVGVIVAGGFTVWGSHLVSKRNAQPAARMADAHIQEAINQGFEKLMGGFTVQLDDAKDEITNLRGWIRELIQHLESLEALLREHGLPVPPRRHAHVLSLVMDNPPDISHG